MRIPGRILTAEARRPRRGEAEKVSILTAERISTTERTERKERGAVLLEVVLALVLLAFAAAVIGGGLHTAISSVERLRLNTHAADLAVSVMSELQLGTKALGGERPERFEWPFEFWTWEAVAVPTDDPRTDTGRTKKVEVVIRHDDGVVTHRLAGIIRLPEIKEEEGAGLDFVALP